MLHRRGIPFRWIFPFGQLALSWFAAGLIRVVPVSGSLCQAIPQIIIDLNLPGGLVQIPIIAFRSQKVEWSPPGIDLLLWRVIAWPALALFFWWLAGRATEALLALRYCQFTPRITLSEAVVGSVLMLGGAVLVFGLVVGEGARIYTDRSTGFVIAGSGLWSVLGALSVVASVRQSRLRRSLARSSAGLEGASAAGASRS